MPPAVVTVTETGPAGPAGACATTVVSDSTVKAAGVAPKETVLVVVRALPVRVMPAPASVGPWLGERAVSTGAAT